MLKINSKITRLICRLHTKLRIRPKKRRHLNLLCTFNLSFVSIRSPLKVHYWVWDNSCQLKRFCWCRKTSLAEKQIIITHILHNISRSKDNHTMKFGLLTEYKIIGVRKNIPEKKPHAENCPPEKCPQENCSLKIVLLDFCCFWHYFTIVPFKTFYSN